MVPDLWVGMALVEEGDDGGQVLVGRAVHGGFSGLVDCVEVDFEQVFARGQDLLFVPAEGLPSSSQSL